MLTHAARRTALSHRFTPLFTLPARLLRAAALHKQRRALLVLDARLLHDIGLTRAQALTEAARPLWDAPASWRHNSY